MTARGSASAPLRVTDSPSNGQQKRRVELVLTSFAVAISAIGWWIVDQTALHHLSRNAGWLLGAYAAMWISAHLLLRWQAYCADQLLLPGSALLNGLGLVMIHRIDLATQATYGRAASVDAPQQLVWTLVGLLAFAAVLLGVRDHRVLSGVAYSAGLIGLVLIALPAVLPARFSEVNGAKLWIRVAGFSIQPGEFAKLSFTVFFAAYLVSKRELLAGAGRRIVGLAVPRGRDMGPLLAVWVVSVVLLVSQKDLGAAVLLFAIFVVCLYISTGRLSWLIVGSAMFAAVAVAAYYLLPHVHTRVTVWLHPFAYPDSGYQMQQSLFSLGTTASSAPAWARATPTSSHWLAPTSSWPRSAKRPACSGSRPSSSFTPSSSPGGFASPNPPRTASGVCSPRLSASPSASRSSSSRPA